MLAVSGGVDSVVLAHLLNELRFNFAIAHCNFQLRGADSEADEEFVQELAKNLGAELFIKSFDTAAFSKERKISIQMAARELRYDWFDQTLDNHDFDILVTAHHRDDQDETILLNFIRGTGLKGLVGMSAKNGNRVRPMLSISKDEILTYAETHDLHWREDQSNLENKYHRNRIRNLILPEMRNINPNVSEALRRLSHVSSNARSLLLQHVSEFRRLNMKHVEQDVHIELTDNADLNEFCLHEILEEFGFNHIQIKNLIEGDDVGKVIVSAGHIANRDRNRILISPAVQHTIEFQIEEQEIIQGTSKFGWEIRKSSLGEVEITSNPNTAFLDYDSLNFPLMVRNWKQGDWFNPLGMKGKKKVSDFMIDAKIPLNLKSRVLVMQSRDVICWVAGHRIDNRFKITEATKNVLIIEIEPS